MSSTSFIAASLDDSLFQGQPAASADAAARKEVVFIDGGVTGYEAMLADLPAGVEIVILEGSGDGLAQMADWAASHSGYDAIHLISHGAEGALQLGGLTLDSATAVARADHLAALGNALSETGDLLLYGCDVADGDGEAFLRQLSALTGADIAASTDITGAASLGGDWALEASTGAVETVSLNLASFEGMLGFYNGGANNVTVDAIDSFTNFQDFKLIGTGDENLAPDGYANVLINFTDTSFTITTSDGSGMDNGPIQLRFFTNYSGANLGNGTAGTGTDFINFGSTTPTESGDAAMMAAYSVSVSDNIITLSYTGAIAAGTFSNGASVTYTFAATNAAPTVTAGTTTAATEQVAINAASTITISDPDGNADWNGGTLKVQITGNADLTDKLSLPTSNPGGSGIWISGTDLKAGTTDIGTVTGSSVSGGTAWTLTFNANATNAFVQSVAQAIQFTADTTSLHPDAPPPSRTITFTATDKGGLSDDATQTVSVTAVDNPPSLTQGSSFTKVTITEDSAGDITGAFTNATIQDDDNVAIGRAIDVIISVAAGTLTANSTDDNTTNADGVEVGNGGAGGTSIMLSGSVADINAYLKNSGNITYQGGANVSGTGAATLTVTARDADGHDPVSLGTITVDITAVNDAPTITSNGGGGTANVNVAENTTTVTTVVATDVDAGDTITYSIDSGADQNLFNINSSTGALTFKSAPDFENKQDANTDGVYTVVVKASDGTLSDSQTINVTVTNVNEAPTLTATGANPTFTEGGSAVTLFSGANFNANDSGQTYSGFTITVTNVSAGDKLTLLGVTVALDSDGSYKTSGSAADNATVSLSGSTATIVVTSLEGSNLNASQINTRLNLFSFSNSGDNPGLTDRLVTITELTDNGASNNSNTGLNVSSTVTVVGQPDVTSVTLPGDNTYQAAADLDFIVNFDQAVTVTGTPRIALTVGSTTKYAEYVSGTGTTALTFRYVVDAADEDTDGIALSGSSIDLNSGTITGTSGSVAADLDLGSVGSLANVKVDGVAPTITSVTSANDGPYGIGDNITITITAANGETGLTLESDSTFNGYGLSDFTDKGDGTYTATYGVWLDDTSRAAGDDIPVSIKLKDAAGNISTAYTTAISQNNDAIDAAQPAAPTLTYDDTGSSNSDDITNDTSLVVGNLEVDALRWEYSLDNGNNWQTGTGTTLTLAQGVYSGATAIKVRQFDAVGNEGVIETFELTVDTTAPIITTGRDTPADAVTNADELIYTVAFDEDVANLDVSDFEMLGTNGAVGTPTLTLTPIDSTHYTVKVSGGNIATYNGDMYLSIAQSHDITDLAGNKLQIGAGNYVEYTLDNTAPTTPTLSLAVDTGSNTGDGITSNGKVNVTGLETGSVREYSVDGGQNWTSFTGSNFTLTGDGSKEVTVRQTDAAGNVSTVSAPLDLLLDTTAATVSSVFVPSDFTYTVGDYLGFTVNVTEAVKVTGTPRIAVTVGTQTVYATYDADFSNVDGNGFTSTVRFKYDVQTGDLDANGIAIGTLELNGGTIQDAAGNNLTLTLNNVASASGVLVDAVAPTLTGSTPADDAEYVALDSNITLTFSEDLVINDSTKSIHIYKNGSLLESFGLSTPANGAPDDGEFQISGNTLIINPSDDLAGDTSYSIRIDAGAFKDAKGNIVAAISDDTTLNFKTIDPTTLVTTGDAFNTTNGNSITGGNQVDNGENDNTIIISNGSHLDGSTLDGGDASGTDIVRLATGSSGFDFTTATIVADVDTLTVDSGHTSPVTVTLSATKGLNSFTTLTGTGDDGLVLAGGGTTETFDLATLYYVSATNKLTGFSSLQMSGAAGTGYTVKLNAAQVSDSQETGKIAAITGSAGSNDTLTLVNAGTIDLTASGLALTGIETVDFDSANDQASRTVTIDQALSLSFGLTGTNSVETAAATLDLSGKSLTGVDALVSSNGTGTAFTLASSQVGSGKVVSITGGSGSDDVLRVDGAQVDFSSLTLSGIETLSNQQSGGGTGVNSTVLGAITTISGNAGYVAFQGSQDISKITLDGITKLQSSTSTVGPLTITVDGSQLGAGKVTTITANGNPTVTLATGSASLDLSAVTLTEIDAVTSTSTSGTAFTLTSAQLGAVSSITGGSGSDDSLRVDGSNVDLSVPTLSGIESYENQTGGATVTIGQTGLDMLEAITGNLLVLSTAATTIDLAAKTLTDVDTILSNVNNGNVKITVAGDQLQAGGGSLQLIRGQDGANVTLYATGSTVDFSGTTLTDIDLITTESTTGVNFTGSGDSDYIRGGTGNDTIFGNIGGTDTLEGGDGNDVFVISGPDFSLIGTTRIKDANTGDTIRINGSTFTTGAITLGDGTGLMANQIHLEDIGGGVTRLHVGIDNTAGADLSIDLDGEYTVDNFKTSDNADLLVSLNDAPVVTVTGEPTSLLENATSVSVGTVTVSDAEGDTLEVRLDANVGTFTLSTGKLTVDAGSATNSDTITLTGSAADINTALATLKYTAEANSTNDVGLNFTVKDKSGGNYVGNSTTKSLSFTVTDVDPVVADQSFAVTEGSAADTIVGTVTVTADTNGLDWSITGGTGSKLFTIDAASGQIKVANGASLNASDSYTLTVAVDDEDADTLADDTATITINVNAVPVSPPPPPPPPPTGPVVVIPPPVTPPTLPPAPPSTTPIAPAPAPTVPVTDTTTEDGATVGRGTGTDSVTGRETEQIIVTPVTSDRQDVGGTPTGNADIRLGGTVEAPTLIATLPTGVGLQSSGATTLTLGELADAANVEAGRINAGGNVQTSTVNLAGLSTVLPASTPVTLRTITPTVAEGTNTAPSQPIVISVPTSTDTSGTVSAVVIDGRSLPSGTVIELRDVDYAVVTGNVFVTGGTGQNVVIGDDGTQYIRLGPDDDTLRGGGGDDTVGSGEGRDLIYGDAGNDSIFGGVGYDRLDGGTGNDTVDGGTGTDIARIHANFADVTITRLADGSVRVVDTKGDQGTDILTSIEVLRLDDRVILLDTADIVEAGYKVNNFSEKHYLDLHPDVAAAVKAGWFTSGLDHYQQHGAAEGRVTSPMFDSAFYLAQNPDVAAAVTRGDYASAFAHFLAWGEAEKRQPDASHSYEGGLFSETYYLEANRDVALAVANGEYKSGYDHWVKWGEAEGRSTFAPVDFDLSLFDEAFYVAQNPDVAAAIAAGIYVNGLDHFARYGEQEGRDASALFDSEWYLEKNPDVAAAVAAGTLSSALEHYSLYGWKEGRDPSAWFDTKKYLTDHADVATSGLNPLAHLLEYGQAEGRLITATDTGMWL